MGSLIGALRVTLGLDSASFEEGAKRTETRAYLLGERIGKSLKGAANSIGSFRAAVTALGSAAAVAGLATVTNKALDYASSLGEVAQQLGVTTRDLQVYRYAATQVGVSQDEMDKGLAKLTVTMGKAREGAQQPVVAFRELSALLGKDVLKGAQTAGDAIPLIAEALSKVPDPSKRAAIEVALFGKAGQKLDTLLSGGAKGVNDLAQRAQELGLVLSDEQIQNADATADRIAELRQQLEARIAGTVSDNADSIVTLADALAKLTGEILNFFKSNPEAALSIIGGLAGARVAGLPGAAAGVVAGYAAGGKIAADSADANMDLKFRRQQLAIAQRELRARQDSAAGKAPEGTIFNLGGLITLRRSDATQSGATIDSASKEVARQQKLLEAAQAKAKAPPKAAPAPVGAGAGTVDSEERAAKAAAAKAEREKARAAAEAYRHDRAYQAELAQTQQEYLRSQADLTVDQVARLALERQQVDADQAAREQQIATDKDLTAAQKGELTSINAKIAANRRELLDRESAEQAAKNSLDLLRADNDNQIDILQSQGALARTSRQRRDVQLRILDLQFQMERATLEAVLASKESTDTEKAIAQKRLDILATLEGSARAGVIRDNQGPLGDLVDSIPRTADEMNEALEGVAAGGLSDITDGLAEAAVGMRSFGDVAKNVINDIALSIAKLAIKQAILGPIAKAIGGAIGGGLGGGMISGDDFLSGALGGESGIAFDPDGLWGPQMGLAGARAGGGSVMAGKRYLVGEMGPEVFEPGRSGRIVANDEIMSSAPVVNQTINFAGAVDVASRTEVYRLAAATKQSTIDAMRQEGRRRG
ncbi:hypothetical protein HY78_18725 [Rhizorhabdus wittichii DC-6]|nr:hypothetical protein HY78_18725 [Rhizorhabdus wittichii DC-6]